MPKASRRKYSVLKGMVSNDGNVYQQNDCVTAWWKLDENVSIIPATTIAQDSSGNGHNGTYKSPDGGPSDGIPGFSYGPPRINRYAFTTGDDAATPSMKGGVYLPNAGNLGLSNDSSFTIQGWFLQRANRISTEAPVLSINVASSTEKRVWLYSDDHLNNKVKLSVMDGTTHAAVINGPKIQLGKWYHFAVTYDNEYLILYVNGKKYGSIQKSSNDPGIQSTDVVSIAGDRDSDGLDSIFRGHFSNFAVWSRALSHDSIKALAGATAGHHQIGSGLLNNPERVIIRDLDNMTGSYPTISRTTGIKGTVGNSPITPFNETRAVQFNKIAATSNYPMVLDNNTPNSTETFAEKYNKNWIATPNISGSLDAPANTKPFLSLQTLTPSIDQGANLTPFDESRINLLDTKFYLTGTSKSILPGFSSRLADKIQIKIPLNTKTSKRVTRFNARGLQEEAVLDVVSQDILTGSFSQTGFVYYNFDLNRWQDIGHTDPLTKSDLEPTFFYTENFDTGQWEPFNISPRWKNRGGGHLKRYQFGMSQHLGHRAGTYEDLVNMGYRHIGSPTISGYAPNVPSYHATSSQTLSLSDYISHPFILEKAVLEIPITVKRTLGGRHSRDTIVANATDGANAMKHLMDGAVRDIDNYTFFMYRQSRCGPGPVDSKIDVSGSQRFLVMSASAAFWNAHAFNSEVASAIVERGLPHSPEFSHDMDLPVSASYYFGKDGDTRESYDNRPMVSEYTGTLRLEMTPAVGSGKKGGGSRFFMRGCHNNPEVDGVQPGSATFYNNIVVQDFWPGGTTFGKYETAQREMRYISDLYPSPLKREVSFTLLSTSSAQFFPQSNFAHKFKGLSPNNVRAAFFKEYPPRQGERKFNFESFTSGSKTTGTFGRTGSMGSLIFPDGRPLRNPLGLRKYEGVIVGETARTSSYVVSSHTTTSYGTNFFEGATNGLVNPGAEFRYAFESLRKGPNLFKASDVRDGNHEIKASGGGYPTLTYTPDIPTSTPSPYVLNPEDRLVFGIDAGISGTPVSSSHNCFNPGLVGLVSGFTKHTAFNQISGSQMYIEAGEASVTLFGSMMRHGKEKLFELNQPLTSDSIHEALHFDNPVVDQFLTAPLSQYSGSYTDRVILGLYHNQRTTDPTQAFQLEPVEDYLAYAPRAVYGHVSRGDKASDKNLDPPVTDAGGGTNFVYGEPSDTVAQNLKLATTDKYGLRWWNNILSATSKRGRDPRSVRAVNYSERYYDTIMPHRVDYCLRSGWEADGSNLLTGTLGGNATEGTEGFTSPASPRVTHNKYAYPYATSITRPLFDITHIRFKVTGSAAKGKHAAQWNNNVFDPGFSSILDGLAINSVLYKKGNFEFGFPSSLTETKIIAKWSPGDYVFPHDPITRATAYAYGILDIRPRYSSAVYRSDTFGQFRDMLEQRQDAKYWMSDRGNPSINSQDGTGEYEPDFVIGFGEADSPVQCRFVMQEDGMTVISPYDTDSNNMSLESTSSMPYFDNRSRNVSTGSTDSSVLYQDSYISPLGRAPWTGGLIKQDSFGPSLSVAEGMNPFTSNLGGGINLNLATIDLSFLDNSGGSGTCFTKETNVTLYDGTIVEIQDINIGDIVIGEDGSKNTVLSLISRDISDDMIYSINGNNAFVTAGHPFKTLEGWKSISPDVSREIDPELFEELGIKELKTGDQIITREGSILIDLIREVHVDSETVYNLDVDGNSTYFANGYLVHNKVSGGGTSGGGSVGTSGLTLGRDINQGPAVKLDE